MVSVLLTTYIDNCAEELAVIVCIGYNNPAEISTWAFTEV